MLPFVSSTKWTLLKLNESTLFSSTVNVLCDAECYIIPKYSGTIHAVLVRMPPADDVTVCHCDMNGEK